VTISVIDYGMGNVSSVVNMLRKLGDEPSLVRDPDGVARADKLILPGVGAFDNAISRLSALGLIEPLRAHVEARGNPLLGICLGMQLLCRGSDEGTQAGLGWLNTRAVHLSALDPAGRLPIPKMGWNSIEIVRRMPLLEGLESGARFYFAHSYFVPNDGSEAIAATAEYGGRYAACVRSGIVFGAQFHPEKSHRFGLQLLANYCAL